MKTLFILCLFWSSYTLGVASKYFLLGKTVELDLSRAKDRVPTSDATWLKTIQANTSGKYTVQPGDNLWSVSKKLFGDAWYWRKLWEVNSWITNPHDLEVGQVLHYYRDRRTGKAIAVVPLHMKKGAVRAPASFGESERVEGALIKNRARTAFFIVEDEKEILGEITGSFTEKENLTYQDTAYIKFNSVNPLEAGVKYLIVREERDINDLEDTAHASLGKLMRVTGEVTIEVLDKEKVRGNITAILSPLQRGDKVIQADAMLKTLARVHPDKELKPKLILAEEPFSMLTQGALVLLNKGSDDGMGEGFVFRVPMQKDPFLDSEDAVEKSFKGEVQVLHVRKNASIGYVLEMREPIFVGEEALPAQVFPDLHSKPLRPNETSRID